MTAGQEPAPNLSDNVMTARPTQLLHHPKVGPTSDDALSKDRL